MISLIVTTCLVTPISLAFPDLDANSLYYVNWIMNSVFTVDIFVNFFSAFYDSEMQVIDDPPVSVAYGSSI